MLRRDAAVTKDRYPAGQPATNAAMKAGERRATTGTPLATRVTACVCARGPNSRLGAAGDRSDLDPDPHYSALICPAGALQPTVRPSQIRRAVDSATVAPSAALGAAPEPSRCASVARRRRSGCRRCQSRPRHRAAAPAFGVREPFCAMLSRFSVECQCARAAIRAVSPMSGSQGSRPARTPSNRVRRGRQRLCRERVPHRREQERREAPRG
jgi:hypothetical protein